MRNSATAWLDRTDPRAAALVAACQDTTKDQRRQIDAEAARRAFIRECERDGIDPARGVSPSLLKLLGEQNAAI